MDSLFVFAACLFFLYRRLLCYLHFYQQHDYDGTRLFKQIFHDKVFDTKGSLIILCTYFASRIFNWDIFWPALCAGLLCIVAFRTIDPRKSGKIRLKMTDRAKTMFYLCLVLCAIAFFILPHVVLWSLATIQLLPLFLIGANQLAFVFEKEKQKRFLHEARAIIADVNPYIIGITGSFGKTSTKYMLAKILQVTLGATFWPPKSFNTLMGITKQIREGLVLGYKYAIIEMGAYQVGSIKKLTELTPPHAAIITGVGSCHLDRFGSLDAIVQAKSELAQAVAENGILVCNGDNEGARHIAKRYPKSHTLLYGFDVNCSDLDCVVTHYRFSEQGTHFTISYKEKVFEGVTPMFGRTSLSNILGAFTMACALGADPEFVLAVIATLDPVDNRLQVKKEGTNYYIHDAFNSNLSGFMSAVEILQKLPAKRRVVMTPGMIELGHLQHEENFAAAQYAGACCDIALIVGNTNRQALMSGFQKAGLGSDRIILCNSRSEAFEKLSALQLEHDSVLIENDLTDIYENTLRF